MPASNRTPEFFAAVESARLRGASGPESRQKLLQPRDKNEQRQRRSDFTKAALHIAKELQGTMLKLDKLAQLAKKKSLFNDRPVEISELTYILKRDMANLNAQIAQLQQLKPSGSGGSGKGGRADEHNANVVVMLQGRLANASMGFKDVLETRTNNMKAARERGQVFGDAAPMSSSNNGAAFAGPSDSPLYNTGNSSGQGHHAGSLYDPKGKGKAVDTGDHQMGQATSQPQSDFLALDMAGPGGNMQSMQMMEQEDHYLSQRSTAIEGIESTIAELGGIFQQLAHMVQQQGETVQRIDVDTSDIANNVQGAQRELLKYYTNMSGNRALMLKVFGVLIVFFMLFVALT